MNAVNGISLHIKLLQPDEKSAAFRYGATHELASSVLQTQNLNMDNATSSIL